MAIIALDKFLLSTPFPVFLFSCCHNWLMSSLPFKTKSPDTKKSSRIILPSSPCLTWCVLLNWCHSVLFCKIRVFIANAKKSKEQFSIWSRATKIHVQRPKKVNVQGLWNTSCMIWGCLFSVLVQCNAMQCNGWFGENYAAFWCTFPQNHSRFRGCWGCYVGQLLKSFFANLNQHFTNAYWGWRSGWHFGWYLWERQLAPNHSAYIPALDVPWRQSQNEDSQCAGYTLQCEWKWPP